MSASAHVAGGPLVSLVMPVWKPRPEWLLQAVESALGQRDANLELIVVDDGCAHPVEELLADVADERLHVSRVEHGGTSAARNAGFAVARGDWIRYLDADDAVEPDSTANLLALAGGRSVIAYGATALCDETLRPRAIITSRLQGDVLLECLLDRFEVNLSALLFPRRVVEQVGDWDPAIAVCQDWDFVLRALEHAHVVGDDRVTYRYRQHAASASAGTGGSERSQRLSEEGMGLVVDRYFNRHPEQRGTDFERRVRARIELILARSHREAYLAHLGRASRGDSVGVLRELGVFARLAASRAKRRVVPVSGR